MAQNPIKSTKRKGSVDDSIKISSDVHHLKWENGGWNIVNFVEKMKENKEIIVLGLF